MVLEPFQCAFPGSFRSTFRTICSEKIVENPSKTVLSTFTFCCALLCFCYVLLCFYSQTVLAPPM